MHTSMTKRFVYLHNDILPPKSSASQYAAQQARPRFMSRTPTLFVIRIETEGDRVYAVALVGWGSGSVISRKTKTAREDAEEEEAGTHLVFCNPLL